jgi:tetratricopeptide (TPR) repeat protein
VSLFIRSLAAFAILLMLGLAAPAILSAPTKGIAVAAAAAAPSAEACLASQVAAPVAAPDVASCHHVALELASEHDFDRAIAIETRLFEREPSNPEVSTALARMQETGRQDVVQALRMYHEALYVSPGYPAALLGLGSHWKGRGEHLIAERYFARGARENPEQPLFKVRLAEVLIESGRPQEAAPILQSVAERFPGTGEADDARRLLGRTALAKP